VLSESPVGLNTIESGRETGPLAPNDPGNLPERRLPPFPPQIRLTDPTGHWTGSISEASRHSAHCARANVSALGRSKERVERHCARDAAEH
jgi:hypothetical protein